jgi:hypothetical protein
MCAGVGPTVKGVPEPQVASCRTFDGTGARNPLFPAPAPARYQEPTTEPCR